MSIDPVGPGSVGERSVSACCGPPPFVVRRPATTPHPAGRGQRREPNAGSPPAHEAGPHSRGGQQRPRGSGHPGKRRSEEHTSELQSRLHLVCRLLLEKKKTSHLYLLRVAQT